MKFLKALLIILFLPCYLFATLSDAAEECTFKKLSIHKKLQQQISIITLGTDASEETEKSENEHNREAQFLNNLQAYHTTDNYLVSDNRYILLSALTNSSIIRIYLAQMKILI